MLFFCAILVLVVSALSNPICIENEVGPQTCWVDRLNITRTRCDLVLTKRELAGDCDVVKLKIKVLQIILIGETIKPVVHNNFLLQLVTVILQFKL